jgi:predicted pyridoxine 5'-phosphate oxidase superfamily flavin-nucleotide-binding protein
MFSLAYSWSRPAARRKDRAMTVLNLAVRAFTPARKRHDHRRGPGSPGEHVLQERFGTTQRAQKFYDNQVVGQLTPVMQEFIARMEMAFIATSDADGDCDCSFRAGPAGFIRILDDHTIAYPEYRGNGVMASLGNMLLNPHIGIFLADFTHDLIGLHLNGDAHIVTPAQMQELDHDIPEAQNAGRRPVQWVLVSVTEAYIHCSKHIPKLVPQSRVRHWGTDNPRHKGGDYFGVTAGQVSAESGPSPTNVSISP